MSSEARPPLRAGHVLPVRIGDGGPTRRQASGLRWRRTSHGFYVPSSTPDDVDQRIVEASVVVPPGHAITGWAALRWRGSRWFEGLDAQGARLPVTIAIGTHDIRPQPGIAISGEGLKASMVEWVDGVPVTDVRYAVSFLMRYASSRLGALVELEKALYNDLVSIDELAEFMTPGQNGWTGIPRAREAIGWADENSWSPREVVMRDVWEVVANRPRPLCNAPIFDLAGRHVATPDLIDPVAGVYGEYEGDVHLGRVQRDADLRREGLLRRHNLEGVTMTAPDVQDPAAFLARLDDAYERASSRAGAARTWTVEPPDWWTSTQTVAQRRALDDDQRRRFLRHRSA